MTRDEDIELTARLLKKFPAGFLPYPVFEQIARIVALPILEFVPLRIVVDKVEVLLLKRSGSDRHWPGQWHTPGTVIRATDISDRSSKHWAAFERILKEELKDTEVGPPHYVGNVFHASKRGAEQAQVYWVEVLGNPRAGEFHSLDKLPTSFMESQIAFIKEAARSFRQEKS